VNDLLLQINHEVLAIESIDFVYLYKIFHAFKAISLLYHHFGNIMYAFSVDILNVIIVLMQVPGKRKLIMNDPLSYYI